MRTATNGNVSSLASATHRLPSCRWCSTTTCATPDRSRGPSYHWHPPRCCCAVRTASGFAAYWEDFWSNADFFYGHFLGFKGMERHAVVLCLDEDGTRQRFRERLCVGLSRATDRLVS